MIDPPISQGGCAADPRCARPDSPQGRALLLDRLGRMASLQARARQLLAAQKRDALGPPQDWRTETRR